MALISGRVDALIEIVCDDEQDLEARTAMLNAKQLVYEVRPDAKSIVINLRDAELQPFLTVIDFLRLTGDRLEKRSNVKLVAENRIANAGPVTWS